MVCTLQARRSSFSTVLNLRSVAYATTKQRACSIWVSSPSILYQHRKQPHAALMMEDIIHAICQQIEDRKDLVAAALCCRRWKEASTPLLWRELTIGTRIPGDICKFTKLANVGSIGELHDLIDIDYICTPSDTTRLQLLLCALHTNPHRAGHVRSISIHLECHFTSFIRYNRNSYIDFDDEDVSANVKEKAWQTFVSRAGLCMRILKLLPRLETVHLTLEVRLEEHWRDEFDTLLKEFAETVSQSGVPRVKRFHLCVGPNAVIPSPKGITEMFSSGQVIPSPRSVQLCSWHAWSPSDVVDLLQNVGPLQMLVLKNGAAVNASVLQAMVRHAPSLQQLEISDTQRVADNVLFDEVLPSAYNLLDLTLDGAVVTWAHSSSKRYTLGCTRLVHLNVNRCIRLPGGFFDAVARTCPLLETLWARDNPAITDTHVRDILHGCKRLSNMDLSRCENLSITALHHVAEACLPLLKNINMQGCPRIVAYGGAGVAIRIAESCPRMRELKVGPVHQKALTVGWRVLANLHRVSDHPEMPAAHLLHLHCDRYVALNMTLLRKYVACAEHLLKEVFSEESAGI
ncbi:uncharacterized protein SPPG_05026 [Spizellomyces punctatus DAOM BR117]|uniref:F-box domain-containing protein n=1 Tax=Spizellomyces punctatus (strain DAOM BR117) TaxID=645134 RepID=A0A0L0HFT8_SPIPD|nr:uncharacterized protein SPPG_05026 [Spizellomyces punctatus DAOM BR117]KNC99643.1 hypothetical protein SPPG_05026 [Spizellomyces punctatus DAOM BR117]|eukprot:XP_016607683.1 hypothetical protein SPPG_05026 [Spizellomyces punctatus DAOM BR117]